MPTLLASLAGLSALLLVFGLTLRNRPRAVARRIERLREDSPADPYESSFAERILLPAFGRLTRRASSLLPRRLEAALDRRLERAGRPVSLQAFTVVWLTSGVLLPLAVLLLVVAFGGVPSGRALGSFGLWSTVGLALPYLWLRRKVKTRMRTIDRSLPDAIDLIVTNVEAGLGLQAAMLAVADKFAGPISVEFSRVVREVSLGRSREEALQDLAERTGVPDMRLFAHAIAQAERTGISVGRVLRAHAKESRERRHQRAREQAAKIPVKMTIPTGLFIFPTLLLVVLGPVALRAWEQFRGI